MRKQQRPSTPGGRGGSKGKPTGSSGNRPAKPTSSKPASNRPTRAAQPDKNASDRPSTGAGRPRKPYTGAASKPEGKPYRKPADRPAKPYTEASNAEDKPYRKASDAPKPYKGKKTDGKPYRKSADGKPYGRPSQGARPSRPRKEAIPARAGTRLNRYLSQAGIASRREADELIANGMVTVNDKVITEMGFMVQRNDVVRYAGETLRAEKNVYLLLNKPKGYISTTDDEKARKTVMELVAGACKERIFPVGRLDRPTTGLLLFTNDGDLAKKLTHPTHRVKKIYDVVLDKNLKPSDFDKIMRGLELEDGLAEVDKLSYIEGKAKNNVGIEIHIGRNRIVRRIFQAVGYEVVKLDRVYLAGLTKKNLPRGRYRFLTPQEVNNLKMF